MGYGLLCFCYFSWLDFIKIGIYLSVIECNAYDHARVRIGGGGDGWVCARVDFDGLAGIAVFGGVRWET